MKKVYLVLLLCLVGLIGSPLLANDIGPVYPAPGGNNFSSAGSNGSGAGATLNYSGFNSSAYSQLYWGPTSVQNVYNTNVGPSGNMTFLNYSGGVAQWNSTANWTFTDAFGGFHSYPTEFLLTFPVSEQADVTSQFAAGISLAPDRVLNVMGNYQVGALFEAFNGGTWTPVDDLYNSFNETCTGCVFSSFNGGFWYTPPASSAAPEPASLVLVGSGLLTMGSTLRRRLRKQACA